MRVYQIIIGNIPEGLQEAVASVKAWASKQGYEYIQISEIADKYKGMPNIRVISNYMRIDILTSEEQCIYFDWDVVLSEEFNLELCDKILVDRMGDQVMYNGIHTKEFLKMRKYMDPIREYELGIIFNAFVSGVIDRDKFEVISNEGWKHLNWSQRK